MTFREFEQVVHEAAESVPSEFKEVLAAGEIRIVPRQKVPQPLRAAHKGSTVFGVFIGVPYGRFTNLQTEPTRIELYKESFDEYYTTAEEIKKQIQVTVVHEIAHYFGFSEKKIRALGY